MLNQRHLLLHGFTSIRDFGRPACGSAGYPLIKQGSISTYVLIAQDDLNTLGFTTGGLDRNIWKQNKRSSKKLSKK